METYNLDDILEHREKFKDRKAVLHCCCAVCAVHVSEIFKQSFKEAILYFYNPNIHPKEEYGRRLEAMRKVADMNGLELAEGKYDAEGWMERVRGLESEPEGGKRCDRCFAVRLGKTAEYGAGRGVDFVASTLTVSPHKDPGLVNRLGSEAAARCGLRFLNADFKKKEGFKKSMSRAKAANLYRQNYCGCVFSQKN